MIPTPSIRVPMMGYEQVYPADNRVWDIFEKRKQVIKNMTDALFAYLTFDIDLALATKDDKPPEPRHTLEDLNVAQEEREDILHQMEAITNALNIMANNEVLNEGIGGMKAVMEAMFLPQLQNRLKRCEDYISDVQRCLENQSEDQSPGDPQTSSTPPQ